jgi:hypothetical protein
MPAAEAWVQMPDADRYLIRLCQHADKMRGRLGHQPRRHRGGGRPPEILEAEWSDTGGILVLSLGRCTLLAAHGMLTIRAEASSPEDLAQIQELITRRLEGFGRRERLTVIWQAAADLTARPDPAPVPASQLATSEPPLSDHSSERRRRPKWAAAAGNGERDDN